jgi:hypothetical protein
VRGVLAPLRLVAARARRRPRRWLLPALGIALAAAFAGGVAAEGQLAGDHSARVTLAGLSPLDRTLRITTQGVVTPAMPDQARRLLKGLGLGARTDTVLFEPVRLTGEVVRPAAIAPLQRWLPAGVAGRLGPCRRSDCPMLLVGRGRVPGTLTSFGVRIRVVGSVPLASAVPLGFAPDAGAGAPLLVTGDLSGLDSLTGLAGIYRTHSWVASLATKDLHNWQLGPLEARLARSQADLLAANSQLALTAPFSGLDAARANAQAAPDRLLLAGGGAVAALALFILLAGGGLRRDQLAEMQRLENAGARRDQGVLFVAAESGWLSAAALGAGAALAIAAAAVLSRASGEPVGGVLSHSLLTPTAAVVLAAGWLAATAIITVSVIARDARVVELLAVAAVSALVVGLSMNTGGGHRLAPLLAPLCCLAAGVLTFRLAAALLRGGERLARRGPVLVRLALVGLARSPAFPSLAIAFIAVSVGLGGFALAYHATLARGAGDEAANQVPLDALISQTPDFVRPLALARLKRWRTLAAGNVYPVRRTDASYVRGAGSVTVPALGVSASALPAIQGWRTSDGSAPLPVLARRLRPPGPVRVDGPMLPVAARWLSIIAASPGLRVTVTADLRDPAGDIHRIVLGAAGARATSLRARIPRGSWELEALELQEPTGLEATNGHQNAENAAPAPRFAARVALGPLQAARRLGRPLLTTSLAGWRAVGAATAPVAASPTTVVGFSATGNPGILRPAQPSDSRPVPVLADPGTAAAAGPDQILGLSVDGLQVDARVVGTVRRFPTVAADAEGFILADEATLDSALDAELPGQGRTDELWVSSSRPSRLHAALASGTLSPLGSSFRANLEHALRAAPTARGVFGTLVAAAVLAAALAVLGLLTALLGGARDERIERDLEAQGIGPRALRADLQLRLALASVLGVSFGLVIAVVLTRLAVASVRAAGTVADPQPPLVTVVPWAELAVWSAGVIAVLVAAGWLTTRLVIGRKTPGGPEPALVADGGALSEGVAT